jgi:hypothetical protein
MYAVLCCCCRRPSSTTSHAINNHRCLLLALNPDCYCYICTITTTTTIVPTPPCPPAQSRLPPTAAATCSNHLVCDVMQCSSCLQLTHGLSLLLLLLLLHVMFMCQWYYNPPAGSAAVAGLWFDWLRLCDCGTESK